MSDLLYPVPTAVDIHKVKELFKMSSVELGHVLGLNDGGRTIRAMLTGVRNGEPFVANQTICAAFWYFRAAILTANEGCDPECKDHVLHALPDFLKRKELEG